MTQAFTQLPQQLDFEGANNFRDLGGYPAADGLVVRSGRLFRSDHLGKLTDNDQLLLAELGVRTVIDLRRDSERDEISDRIDDPNINQLWLPIAAKGADVLTLRREIEKGNINDSDAEQILIQANKEFVEQFSHVFKDFFAVLLDEKNYPIVFHCSAGKDRVGLSAALTMLAVGCPMESVQHDYLATNHCTQAYINGIIDGLNDMPALKSTLQAVKTLMQVQPAFLQAALDTIDTQHGGIDQYFSEVLAMGDVARSRLRQLLCE